MKRLFIAINVPPDVKKRIEEIVEDLKIRFSPPENWHLTISFLGYQADEVISQILNSLKETVQNFSAPAVEFEKIIYGPPNKPPRMIWLTGSKQTSKILSEIKNKLEDALVKNEVLFKRENREYNCHLTLARFQSILRTSDVLSINQFLDVRCQKIENLSFQAYSLDLMESYLKPAGVEYEILASLTFSEK